MEFRTNAVDLFGRVQLEGGSKPLKLIGLCLLISAFVAILYFNSLGNQFTNWDDGMIYENSQVRHLDWTGIRKIFSLEQGNTYQPIRMLSYAIDYKIWGLNPVGYHITNILFYIWACLMVFFTVRILSFGLRESASFDSHNNVALLGSLLFAAHPVHVEAITWLAARKEVLQGFFFFLAFYLYLKGRHENGSNRIIYLGSVLLSILLAILSKPSAIVFPAVILVYEISLRRGACISFLKNQWFFFILTIIISAVFTSILIKVMVDAGGIKPYYGGSFFNNLLVSLYVFFHNISLLLFTINYSAAYTVPVSNPLSLRTFVFIGIALLLFGISFWSLKRTKIIFFSFLFFFVTLLPYLNIIPISTLLADRYLFISSFSYCFLLGVMFDEFSALTNKRFSVGFFKLLATVLFMFLLVGYSFMTIRQNKIWENSYTLWADAVEKYPDSNRANALMGVVYMGLRMDEKASDYLEKAVQILPYDYQSRNNLGIVYGRSGEPEKALREFSAAMQLMPDDDTIKVNLSVFYQRYREYKKAEEVLKYLLSKSPQNANLHFRLGLIYRDAGRYEEAVSEFLRSVDLAPHIINGYEELGNIYASKITDLEKAKYYYHKGVEAAPKAKNRIEDLRWMIQDLER